VGAGIQWLSEKRANYIFATHLHDLPTLLDPDSLRLSIWHLHVEYDPVSQSLVYHRQLRPGSGSSLYGLEVARAMDLPAAFLEKALANRRILVGAVQPHEAKPSAWNPAICRRLCEVCGQEDARTLEVHHIQTRASATNGILEDGTPVHAPSNLTVLCAACHDKRHHPTPSVRSKRPDTEIATIQDLLKKHKTASLKALVYQLKSEHEIVITSQALAAFRRGY
jgi:DNA mismatch repair protein MutS